MDVIYGRRAANDSDETASWTYQLARGAQVTGTIDNSWVVSYSPKLSAMFQCHLNVEICISCIEVMKYLFKYDCKRNNPFSVLMVPSLEISDEIRHFQDSPYVLASEALWRLFRFEIIDRNLPDVRHYVHLENHRTVNFRERQQYTTAQQSRPETKITKWFKCNAKWTGAALIYYVQFLCYFTWNKILKT